LQKLSLRLLTRIDALANRLYSARLNPLYQSGTIVVVLYLTLLATGLWLILFYRVGAPWESVARLTANAWIGNWVRGLHRYASDAAVVATLVHAFRMFAQGRSWGARALAWVSGGLLTFLLLLCGWTGYVLVWDTFGERLAIEGARMLDALPVLSEPLARAFTGERPVPSVFFFVTLFAHIGIPLGMGVVFWLHIKRLERPLLLPPTSAGLGVGRVSDGHRDRGAARHGASSEPVRLARSDSERCVLRFLDAVDGAREWRNGADDSDGWSHRSARGACLHEAPC
jgi:quinol-cytochrome oxidoreductase complex cytochrome b subunit